MGGKKIHAISAILVCTAFTLNCSFLMKSPPSGYDAARRPDCTDSYIIPASDLLQAISSLVLGLALSGVDIGGDKASTQGYVFLGTGALYAAAAIYGFFTASKCRTAIDRHEKSCRKMRRLLARVQLPGKPALPPAPLYDPWDPKRAIAILKQHKLAIRKCMDKQTRMNPELKGKFTATFTVAPNGQVLSLDVITPEFQNTPLAECLDKLIRSIQFPEFEGQPQKAPFHFEVK